jgi:hypothetical protein
MATRMQQRRGTAAQWTTANPVLNAGEIGYESDTNKFKIGDGDNHWDDLNYFLDAIALGGNIDDYIPLTQRAVANGVATLDGSGKVPANQIPNMDELSQDAINTALVGGDGITKTYDDNGNTITLDVDITSGDGLKIASNKLTVDADVVQKRVTNVTDVEIGYLDGVSSGIQNQINDKLSISAGGTMSSSFSMGSNRLTALGAPTADSDAATKLYVDNVTAGINFHESVHVASTANSAVIYNNGTNGVGATLTADTNRAISTLDGESVALGERILMKNQTDAKQNGIYVLTAVGSVSAPWVMTRATDADNNPTGEMKTGDFTFVQRGTVNASVGYINNSTASPIVIGTDNISYTEFSAGKTVVAGNGLTEATPGTLSIDTSITQARVANVTDTEIGYLDGVTSAIQTQLNDKLAIATAASTYETISNVALKAPLADPTFTGTVSGISKSMVGLGNVDNTSDANKPVSTATQTALDAKISSSNAASTYAPLASPTFTGTVVLPSDTSVGTVSSTELGYVDGVTSSIQTQLNGKQAIVANVSDVEIGYLDGVTSAIQTQLDAKSTASKTETLTNKTLTSPVINTPTGITKTDVGLANVDNTSDANKPVSTATQTALALKANLAGPTFTGTLSAADLTISGNLTVNGTTTNLNSTNLVIEDKNIVLGDAATPTDTTADGGGITLKGATDKTFNWVDATDSWTSSEHINLASGKDLKVNGTAVISSTAGGFIFTDGTQTKEGVPSRTPIIAKTDSYTLSALSERDSLIEVAKASATTITIPLNSAVAFPVGTSLDILQTSTGQVTIAGTAGVTVNATPGLKLRTQWSSATLFKRAENTWVVYGDLTA